MKQAARPTRRRLRRDVREVLETLGRRCPACGGRLPARAKFCRPSCRTLAERREPGLFDGTEGL